MAEAKRVWVVTDPGEPLDEILLETLRDGLEGVAKVVERRRRADDDEGVAERLLRSLTKDESQGARDLVERLSETEDPPCAVVTTRPGDAVEIAELARRGGPETVVIGVSRGTSVEAHWTWAPVDLLLVADEYALSTMSVHSERARVTGVPVEPSYVPAVDAPAAREEAGLVREAHVVLIGADVFAAEELSQLMVQLDIARVDLDLVFEVADATMAEELRRLVPIHGLSASLIPEGERGAAVWPLAHLIIGRARPRDVWRARAAQVPFLCAPSRDDDERAMAGGLVASKAGRAIETMSTFAVDLDITLEPQRWEALVARGVSLAAEDSRTRLSEVILEAIERGPGFSAGARGLPDGLERIGRARSDHGEVTPDRFDEAARAATSVRNRSESWRERARLARSHGDEDLAREADKLAARHHEQLDRLLETLRPEGWSGAHEEAELEEELEALRRRAMPRESVESRLKSLEVEDELRVLKERLGQE